MNLNVGFTENAESFAAGLNKNKKDFDAKYSDVKLIPGKDGKDGFSPIVTVESIFGGHRVTITDASGTQVFDVMNGEDGSPGATGSPGAAGSPGKDGYSPSVTVVPITGGNRVTITDTNGIKTFDIMDGSDGKDGLPGIPGKDGKDGVSVSHKWNGTVLEVTSVSGTSSADLRGEQGIQGVQGIQGERGIPGTPGKDGYSPTVSIASITGGHRVTIVDVTGPQTFDIIDGVNGKDGSPGATGPAGADGAPGKDGANGKDGKDGYSPQKGIDYFTDADKAEMIQAIINALPVYNGEVVSA